MTFAFANSPFTGLFLLHNDFAFPQAFLLMLASFSLFTGAGAMGIFSIFARVTQQSIDRMNQIKTIPKFRRYFRLKNISFVFQDVFLFNDTVLNNIRVGRPDTTIEEVCEAAQRAGCAEFIEAMEDGYDTVIGEAGANLIYSCLIAFTSRLKCCKYICIVP